MRVAGHCGNDCDVTGPEKDTLVLLAQGIRFPHNLSHFLIRSCYLNKHSLFGEHQTKQYKTQYFHACWGEVMRAPAVVKGDELIHH